ncbi:MASE3 domain-containing protein [Leptothrix ochracea]|uniref:bifunctional diguanylate cyclase/phosphodiesterase n=1 Tax=Leptothrix ochracea TaxID=735331 RepID=UPI0034E1E51D
MSLGDVIGLGVFIIGIHVLSHYNYLLFHIAAELFSVFIAVTIGIIAVNCWQSIQNQYVLFIGVGYFFIGLLDVLHTLTYKGMPIFNDYDYYAPQFWIAARYLETFSMLLGFAFLGTSRRVNGLLTLGGFTLVTAWLVSAILYVKNFPVCFVAGHGLTPFKVISEYIICTLMLVNLALLHRRRHHFDPGVYRLIRLSVIMMILMELCFTLYVSDTMSDAINQTGHMLKIVAFYMIYKAVVVTGLRHPQHLLFRELSQKEAELETRVIERTQMLAKQSEKNLALLHNASDGITIMDRNANLIEVSDSFCDMLGYTREEMIGMNVTQWDCGFSTPEEMMAVVQRQFEQQTRALFETRHRRKDGSTYDVEISGYPIELEGTMVLFNSSRDITERKRAEQKLQLAANVFAHANEGIMVTTLGGVIVEINETFTRITGYSRDEVVGKTPSLLSSGRQSREFYASMWRALIDKGHWSGEIWNRHKSGEFYATMQTISAVRDAKGQTQQYVALFSDITPLKEHENKLEYIAHYDALTRLPNRVLLSDRLHQAMTQAMRRKNRLAVAFLDLDGFKTINDQHGHAVGDQVLVAMAARMRHALRDGDTLARLGGDEFVAVLLDLESFEASGPLLARLLDAASQPLKVDDLDIRLSASLGVTFFPQNQDVDADQLLRQADQAMYQAKLAGKNRYHVFDAELAQSVRGHHESLERLRQALNANEFVLHYQPKVHMRTGQVIGAEALIRWEHPTRGLLFPAQFLSVIEGHALSIHLGEWVLHHALTQIEQWRASGLDLKVSVNVGARQLQQADFAERLRVILAAHPEVRHGQLQLEVLETSALDDITWTANVIESCRKLGVTFSLDDFGTGYSSLTYLKRLPVVELKIDQSFVRNMLEDPDDLAILNGVIGLANAFNRQVIAEGVENVESGTLLLKLGCELAQGYGIARPMPGPEMPAWCLAWRPDPAWTQI